ncbi:hypothetical protein [Sandarakinorhabdus oryzae]|uniref:hypothetical protein n=1 Tax=Sandarakinorhabdus oryzae TaxID=2675220 RepID=UPI0012E1374B|nr:hypothetical protein [Sandarakinorhabdus oryzae]
MVAPVSIDYAFDLSCEGPLMGTKQRFHIELSIDVRQKRWCERPGCEVAGLKVAGDAEILLVRTTMKNGQSIEQRLTYNRGNGRFVNTTSSGGKAKIAAGLCVERNFTPLPRAAPPKR